VGLNALFVIAASQVQMEIAGAAAQGLHDPA
jgi:hypothetical protein